MRRTKTIEAWSKLVFFLAVALKNRARGFPPPTQKKKILALWIHWAPKFTAKEFLTGAYLKFSTLKHLKNFWPSNIQKFLPSSPPNSLQFLTPKHFEIFHPLIFKILEPEGVLWPEHIWKFWLPSIKRILDPLTFKKFPPLLPPNSLQFWLPNIWKFFHSIIFETLESEGVFNRSIVKIF